MDDFRSRLIAESMELKDRLAKLRDFINGKKFRHLDRRDRELLYQQQGIMSAYNDVLEQRLARW